jgi:hypothetical protein
MNSIRIRINIDPQPHNSSKESPRLINYPTKLEYEELDLRRISINPSPRGVVRGIGRVGIILMGCWLLRTRSTSLPRVRPIFYFSWLDQQRMKRLMSSCWTDIHFLLGKG